MPPSRRQQCLLLDVLEVFPHHRTARADLAPPHQRMENINDVEATSAGRVSESTNVRNNARPGKWFLWLFSRCSTRIHTQHHPSEVLLMYRPDGTIPCWRGSVRVLFGAAVSLAPPRGAHLVGTFVSVSLSLSLSLSLSVCVCVCVSLSLSLRFAPGV